MYKTFSSVINNFQEGLFQFNLYLTKLKIVNLTNIFKGKKKVFIFFLSIDRLWPNIYGCSISDRNTKQYEYLLR